MWVVGIDEAGYGPNLGPLVQTAVALRLPDGDPAGWETLRAVVRRAHEEKDHRLLVDDSKKVYVRGGLEALEHGVRAPLILLDPTVGDLFRKAGLPGVREELAAEAWYDPTEPAPVVADAEAIFNRFVALNDGLPGGAGFGPPAAHVVPAPRFNRVCDESGSKGTVLSLGLVELLRESLTGMMRRDGEPVTVLCDKLGGRNYYAALVQQAFPDGWVVAERESADESRYRVEHLDRPVTVVFRPRADADSVAVALASMLAKYLREVCMRQFNRFWARHVPGLAPTAGYPGDAKRFYAEIRGVMEKLGLSEDQVWRKR
jgi:ribonuclease HII